MLREPPPILIMTATIQPPSDAHKLVHVDPQRRLADYVEALRFYLAALDAGTLSGIVFAENSMADMSALRELVDPSGQADRVEFVQFFGLDYPGSFGRAYGEFKLLDHAMKHSRLIQACGDTQRIWKVSGRYRVPNLSRVLAGGDMRQEMWVHCRDYPMRWADMYLFGWRKDFYGRVLSGLHERFNESLMTTSAEVAFRDWLDDAVKRERIARRINPPPELVGIRGFDGANYGDRRLKTLARGVAAVVAPWVWI